MIVELMQAQRLKKNETHVSGFIFFTCKDGTSTYYPELTEIEKIYPHELTEMEQRETLEIKRDAARSKAEKFERMSENSLDAKNRRKYAARAKQWREREAEVNGQLKAMEEKPKPKPEQPKTQEHKPEQPKPSTAKAEKANGNTSVVDSWEAENYKNSTEAGLLITSDGKRVDFGGIDHHVTGKTEDIELMDGAVFTHNHPSDNTFTQKDIVTGIVKGNLKELRAVTSTGDVHILANNGSTEEQRKKFSAAYQQRRMKAANAADSKIRKGERINKDEYVKSRLEAFMSEHADDYNLKYSKAKIKPKSLEKSGRSGIIELQDTIQLDDIQIFRTLSARAKNYDVMDLITGDIYHIAEGTKIQNVQVFAGKGTRKPFRNAAKYAERYGGAPEDWQHVKGFCELVTSEGNIKAEIHWVQCDGIGKKEFFVKEWFE